MLPKWPDHSPGNVTHVWCFKAPFSMAKSTKNNMLRTLDAESRSVLSAYVNFHLWGPHVQSSFKDESHLWLIRPLGTPLCNLRSNVGMGEMAEILLVLETMEYPHDHSELRCRTLSDIHMYNMFRSPIDLTDL